MRMSWSGDGVWYARLLHKRRQGDLAGAPYGRGRSGACFLHRSISDISLDEHCKHKKTQMGSKRWELQYYYKYIQNLYSYISTPIMHKLDLTAEVVCFIFSTT